MRAQTLSGSPWPRTVTGTQERLNKYLSNEWTHFQLSVRSLLSFMPPNPSTWMSPKHLKGNVSQYQIHSPPIPSSILPHLVPILMRSSAIHLSQEHGHLPSCFLLPHCPRPSAHRVFYRLNPPKWVSLPRLLPSHCRSGASSPVD